jgi:iron(III) transport system substrate-binding protein
VSCQSVGRVRRSSLCLSAAALAFLALLAAACTSPSKPNASSASPRSTPATSPPTDQLVTAAKNEHGLVIYGNPPADNFAPVVKAFNAVYPGIKVQFTNLGDNESFAKYEAEHAQGARTADVLIASGATPWVNSTKQGVAKTDFVPSGLSNFPRYAQQLPGVFVMSPEPILAAWSPKLIPANQTPTSYAQLVASVQSNPKVFAHKLVSYTIDNPLGYAAIYGMEQIVGKDTVNRWLDVLGPNTKAFGEGLSAMTDILSGHSSFDWTVSGLAKGVLKSLIASGVAQDGYMTDATPIVPRGIAVTQGATSPASAELFLDFLFSQPGQDAMCKAGFTAYMNNYKPVDGCIGNLADVYAHVSEKNTYLVPFSQAVSDAQPEITARWNKAFGR